VPAARVAAVEATSEIPAVSAVMSTDIVVPTILMVHVALGSSHSGQKHIPWIAFPLAARGATAGGLAATHQYEGQHENERDDDDLEDQQGIVTHVGSLPPGTNLHERASPSPPLAGIPGG
jgi:hypothetical protein